MVDSDGRNEKRKMAIPRLQPRPGLNTRDQEDRVYVTPSCVALPSNNKIL